MKNDYYSIYKFKNSSNSVIQATIFSQDAIAATSFYEPPRKAEIGDVEKAFLQSDKVVEGEVEMGGQLHFYMETQRCLLFPRDGGELEVFTGGQNPHSAQVF